MGACHGSALACGSERSASRAQPAEGAAARRQHILRELALLTQLPDLCSYDVLLLGAHALVAEHNRREREI